MADVRSPTNTSK